MLEKIVKERMEAYVRDNRAEIDEILESAVESYMENFEMYEVFFNAIHDNIDYIMDGFEFEEIASDVVLNNI